MLNRLTANRQIRPGSSAPETVGQAHVPDPAQPPSPNAQQEKDPDTGWNGPDAASPLEEQPLGVYEFLLHDRNPLSAKAIALLNEAQLDVRPRPIAYLGMFILIGALGFLGSQVPRSTWDAFPAEGWTLEKIKKEHPRASAVQVWGTNSKNISTPQFWQVYANYPWEKYLSLTPLAALILILWLYVWIRTTRIILEKGRLQITRGLLFRRQKNVELWRVQRLQLRRSLIQNMTGEGTLVFWVHYQRRPITVTGIPLGREGLEYLYQLLLDLTFALRSHPVVKGIIA
jgi:hypothetical protein